MILHRSKENICKSLFCIDNPLEEEKESTKAREEGVEVRDELIEKKIEISYVGFQ